MKSKALKEVEVVLCDLCEKELDTNFYGLNAILDNEGTYSHIGISNMEDAEWYHICKECYQSQLVPWLESQKKNIKPTV